eukprot:TRINITY_DN7235_c0_g1_i1.p1 TRINITY_DN7235_c0_g1~~TRINITY_DN7235_c0_g1_i1.p1  ORF type:complete len:92 (+),score=4.29 TRINITY_DN7235_c0_g1_i1:199-474(+)
MLFHDLFPCNKMSSIFLSSEVKMNFSKRSSFVSVYKISTGLFLLFQIDEKSVKLVTNGKISHGKFINQRHRQLRGKTPNGRSSETAKAHRG